MGMQSRVIEMLASAPEIGYLPGDTAAAEPTALASLALIAAGELDAGYRHLSWLARIQSHAGSVGVFADQGAPAWCTGLAVMAWSAWETQTQCAEFSPHLKNGIEWLLGSLGVTMSKTPELGHDPTLAGWSWAEGTHAWVEPTAFQVLALKAVRMSTHPRTRDGIRLLLDRQLPQGGCNYGNTFVLGQKLVPHIQPTALALLALQGEPEDSRRALGLAYLRREWRTLRGTSSRCFAAMALRAYPETRDIVTADIESLLGEPRPDSSGYHLALMSLALASSVSLISEDLAPLRSEASLHG